MATRVAYLETEAIIPARESWASVSATLLRGRRPERPDCLEPHDRGATGQASPPGRSTSRTTVDVPRRGTPATASMQRNTCTCAKRRINRRLRGLRREAVGPAAAATTP